MFVWCVCGVCVCVSVRVCKWVCLCGVCVVYVCVCVVCECGVLVSVWCVICGV